MGKELDADNLESLQKGLLIDKDALDEEFITQADLYYRIASAFETALMERDSCKIDIEQAEAELYIQFSKKGEEAQERVTDTSIKRQVTTSPKIIKLNQRYLRLKERAGKLGAMKDAYEQRGKSMGKLADLYIANYYTTESGGKRRSEVTEERAEEAKRLRHEQRKGKR